jgi:hypothetical protein
MEKFVDEEIPLETNVNGCTLEAILNNGEEVKDVTYVYQAVRKKKVVGKQCKTVTLKAQDRQNASEGSSAFHAVTRNLHHLKRRHTTIKFNDFDINAGHAFLMSKFNSYYGTENDRPMEFDYLASVAPILCHYEELMDRILNMQHGDVMGIHVVAAKEEEEKRMLTMDYHSRIQSEWLDLETPDVQLPTITTGKTKTRSTNVPTLTETMIVDMDKKKEIPCENCGCTESFLDNVFMTCAHCGLQISHGDNAFVYSYEELNASRAGIKTAVSYKKINHFNEWLACRQCKETVDVPSFVIESVKRELEKDCSDWTTLDENKIRQYLKKLGYASYYENIPKIIYSINGKQPLRFSLEVEEQLREMFTAIQEPFMLAKPSERTNFLSYGYVLHKFVELLNLDDEYKSLFPLLKSVEKLRGQDQIWQKICEQLGWFYIPSI